MKIQAFTLHNPKHHSNLFNWPEEDSFKYLIQKNKTIVAVADGITRDPIGLPHLPDYHTLIGEIELAIEYPIPSPAKKAADLFCESFIKHSKTISKPNLNSIKKSIIYSNHKIKLLNKNTKIDYLEKDFAACVASAGIIQRDTLYYAHITDCGIVMFNKKGKLKFKTKNEQPSPEIEKIAKKQNTSFREPKWRSYVRSHFRNNPEEPLSYGAFTGEKTALHFTRFEKTKIEKGDYLIFYSDGMFPIVFSKNFNITKHFPDLKEYIENEVEKIGGSEGTIVALSL
ncbi:MAG: hypothetical protein ABIG28_00140 [archaeon]